MIRHSPFVSLPVLIRGDDLITGETFKDRILALDRSPCTALIAHVNTVNSGIFYFTVLSPIFINHSSGN